MQPAPMRSVLPFFALTFLWSWAFFLAAVPHLRTHGFEGASWWAYAALLLGSYGPTLMALVLTAHAGGRPAVARLLKGLAVWRGRSGKLWAAFLFPSLLSLVALALYLLLGGGSVGFDFSRVPLIPVAVVAALPFGPLAEEVGWRGYAQPRLLERRSPLATGVILGVVWTAWHVPLFFAPAGTSISGEPITVAAVAFYLALLVGLSLLIVHLSLWTQAPLLTGLLVHLGLNAEVYRLLFAIPEGGHAAIERWTLVPLGALAAGFTLNHWRGSRGQRRVA